MAIGINDGGFECTTRGRMSERLFREPPPDLFVVCGRATKDGFTRSVKYNKAALASFPSDFRKRRRFTIPLCTIRQGDTQKNVFRHRSCAGGDDERISGGYI